MNSIPLVRAPTDVLRHGWHKACEDTEPLHPVEMQANQDRKYGWEAKMTTVENIYGMGAAMRLRTEKAVMEQFTRLPGLPSSRLGLDIVLGTDGDLDFSDVLNDPNESMQISKFQVHEAMEVKMGLL